jgi:hypothetical protein
MILPAAPPAGYQPFVDNGRYFVAVKINTFTAGAGPGICTWPTSTMGYNTITYVGNTYAVIDTIYTGDSTPPTITAQTNGIIAKTANLSLTFSEPVSKVPGQVVKIYENGTNTLVATVNIGDATVVDNVVTIPNALFNTFLQYSKCYYAQFNAGLVTDTCGNASIQAYLTTGAWTFCIEADPAPAFVSCTQVNNASSGFDPKDDSFITSLTPTLKIKFSEPVVTVASKKIDIYEQLPSSAVAILGSFNVSSMTATPGSNNTEYTIPFSAITSVAGTLTYGNCYFINIEAGAFKETLGTQVTPGIVSFQTANTGSATACNWNFCVQDVIAPTVTFWPNDGDKNIPLNAYLVCLYQRTG